METNNLTKKQKKMLDNIWWKLQDLQEEFEKKDIKLNYGNGTVLEQIECCIANLECILQEHPF